MTAIWLLCMWRLQSYSGCAVKWKETFTLMISWASFCPFWICCSPRSVRQDTVCSWICLLRRVQYILTCSAFILTHILFPLPKWQDVLAGPVCSCGFVSVCYHFRKKTLSSLNPCNYSPCPLPSASLSYFSLDKTLERKMEKHQGHVKPFIPLEPFHISSN